MNSLSSLPKTEPLLDSAATELKTLFQDVCPPEIALPSILPSSPPIAPRLSPETPTTGKRDWLPSLCLRLVWGVSGVGAIVLTLTTGLLGGAMLAQRYGVPDSSLANPIPGVEAMPVLEKVFRYTAAQRDRLQTWIPLGKPQDSAQLAELTIALDSLPPDVLAQWEPGNLALEIDRLQTEAQALENQVSALETKLNLNSADREQLSISARLNRIDRALNPSDSSGSLEIGLSPQRPSAQRPLAMTLPTDILFEEGKAVFKPEAIDFLQNLTDTLESELSTVNSPSTANFMITIATHTDDVGSEADNLKLSFQRSQLLENQLNSDLSRFGFKQLTWNTLGYGETAPLVDNSTSSNRQRNRRVELTIHMD